MNRLNIPGFRRALPMLAILLISGCSSLSYYTQLASGQLALLRAREPVAQVITDPQRDPNLRDHLLKSQQARDFASQHLHLPDNKSYRLYADIHRPYVVWNVFATGEFSLDPVTHCFPIAGCVAYRGYYSQGAARGEAALQKRDGKDVYVSGVEAYSTLGWFNDPIISSMMVWGDERLATLIFHELAHQRFYVKDDSEFNESYATFVEEEGTRQWRAERGMPAETASSETRRRDQLTRLVLHTRERLKALYAAPLAPQVMRQRKAAEFERLRVEYRQLRDSQWGGDKRFDSWIYAPMNNARLLPIGLYDQWVPAFERLFNQVNGAWPAFFDAVEHLGGLPTDQRKAALARLAKPG
ncbi:aminopeptidase [Pseudomonas sp. LP_7_YM]|uniref:aminopeptidase n=1 Tax=Pseudomonas sp. LP_7_YM TaxID=2485137 RepID=UPI00105E2175|nr:aminopeptidase [Pseudomonas sp. LP_7_YM]TDV59870.1 putative aminopeptidase [Pseudomonas sp. LP_7_YM]